jgi:hypothetical protein
MSRGQATRIRYPEGVARFLRAVGGVRFSVPKVGQIWVSPAVRAGTLLGVLLLHLAFMASPLHASMLGIGERAHPAEVSPSEVAAAQDEPAGPDDHCLVEWARSSEGQAGLVMFGAPPPDSITAVLSDLSATRPIARAHGPPSHADAQALLQVFRL